MKNNPYVGPRPYEREDRHNFFGRDWEARELRALIVAEREVLFYAQSGAGKSSLLNATVIPALEEKGFHVLPVVRVGNELPPEIGPRAVSNVFVFSALLTLAGADAASETLLDCTLSSFLTERYPDDGEIEPRPLVLVFDQFEEIFTTHRDRWQDAGDFFRQVREALDALPRMGVVFAMREDHVAAMDPYIPLFPRRLRARFRMERLGPKGALEAVTRPALNAGCPFDPGVAEQLVDDLRRVVVGQDDILPHGEAGFLGPYVEPVQLQVVCNRLWESLPEQADQAIQWIEVEQYGNIDRALTGFYESALAQAAEATGVSERQLRRWFDEQLITPMGTRGLVLRGEQDTGGLPNAAVDILENQHLIRADARAGARWYELVHDRLMEPILASNRAWQSQHQDPLTAAAADWLASDKNPQKLLRGFPLKAAQAQAEASDSELTETEKEFIRASVETTRAETARRQRLILLGAASLLVFFALLTGWALLSANAAALAREQAEVARVQAESAREQAESARAQAEESAGTAIAERATAQAAITAMVVQLDIAQVERDRADEVRATLIVNLEINLTAQAVLAEATVLYGETPTPTPELLTSTPTPLKAEALPEDEGTPLAVTAPPPGTPTPTAPPTPTPTPTPNLDATATVEALQAQLEGIRATQTAVAEYSPAFVYGVVVSFGGSEGDWLLKDPTDEQSGIVWVAVGTEVTVMDVGEGSLSYGSGRWYYVSFYNVTADQTIEGWLPAEVVTELSTQQMAP